MKIINTDSYTKPVIKLTSTAKAVSKDQEIEELTQVLNMPVKIDTNKHKTFSLSFDTLPGRSIYAECFL